MQKFLTLSVFCSLLSSTAFAQVDVKKEAAKVEAKAKEEIKKVEPDAAKKMEAMKKAEADKGVKKDAPAVAAPEAPPMMEPSKELAAAFAELTKKKTLNCKSKVPAGMMGPAYEAAVKQSFSFDLNNFFVSSSYEEKKGKANPNPYMSKSVATYDSMKKQIVRSDFDGMGGVSHWTSPGWEGDKLVFTGKMMTGMEMRDTMTKGAKEWTQVVEAKGKDGAWMILAENVCK
jgi:hypothetical protein